MRGIERIFAILTTLGSEPGMALSEVADRIELPRPTVLRFLRALQNDGWVMRDSDGRYRLGPAIMALSSQYASTDALLNRITPLMHDLRDDVGETISLCRSSGRRRLCIREFVSTSDLRLVLGLGTYGPLHAGASGLVLLAHLPQDERDAIIEGEREIFTPSTIADPDQLRAECELIRERGWSITVGQRTSGGIAAAVAVADPGAPHGVSALGVYGPEIRASQGDAEVWVEKMLACARLAETG